MAVYASLVQRNFCVRGSGSAKSVLNVIAADFNRGLSPLIKLELSGVCGPLFSRFGSEWENGDKVRKGVNGNGREGPKTVDY